MKDGAEQDERSAEEINQRVAHEPPKDDRSRPRQKLDEEFHHSFQDRFEYHPA
jgi:hypothetical protein